MSGATLLLRNPAEEYGLEYLTVKDAANLEQEELGVLIRFGSGDTFIPWANVVRIAFEGRRPEYWGRPY
jgi:hypothetical protein